MITKYYFFLLSPLLLRKHILSSLFVLWQIISRVISVTEKVQTVFTHNFIFKGQISLLRHEHYKHTLIEEYPDNTVKWMLLNKALCVTGFVDDI